MCIIGIKIIKGDLDTINKGIDECKDELGERKKC